MDEKRSEKIYSEVVEKINDKSYNDMYINMNMPSYNPNHTDHKNRHTRIFIVLLLIILKVFFIFASLLIGFIY